MTAPRDPNVLIRAFLEEGRTELSDRVFDEVRRDIHATRQRAVIGRWREPTITSLGRAVIAIAAVVVVAVAGIAIVPSRDGGGGPAPSPTPTPTATPTPLVTARPIVRNAALPPGRYVFLWSRAAGADGEPGPSILINVPSAGWTSYERFAADKNYGPGDAGAGPSFVVWKITNRYTDPCTHDTVASPAPGPGVDALLEALANQSGITGGAVTPVTVDGYTGKYVDLTVATDIATCPEGFFPWVDKFVQGNNEQLRVYALDVDGFRLTFFLRIPERTTTADRAELDAIVDSIGIEP